MTDAKTINDCTAKFAEGFLPFTPGQLTAGDPPILFDNVCHFAPVTDEKYVLGHGMTAGIAQPGPGSGLVLPNSFVIPAPLPETATVIMTPELEKQLAGFKADELRRLRAAEKDSAMLGDSGYDRIDADFYPTPPENVDCLLTHIVPNGKVWEPACGNGAISKRLIELGYRVVSTDLFDHGYGKSNEDFLQQTEMRDGSRTIITNPPYADMAEKFIRKALELTEPVKGQVCMFLRNEFDCGKGKMSLFGLPPFHKKIVVTKRPRWIEGSTGSPRHNYSWFVWDWRHIKGAASIVYSHPSKVNPILGPSHA